MQFERLVKIIGLILMAAGVSVAGFETGEYLLNATAKETFPWLTLLVSGLIAAGGLSAFRLARMLSRGLTGLFSRIFYRRQSVENRIHEEIRSRVLSEARRRCRDADREQGIKATLDALEQLVDMPRSEMEEIARQVCAEYDRGQPAEATGKRKHKTKKDSTVLPFPWTAAFLVVITFFLLRRGSPWYLLTGAFLLAVIIRWLVRPSSEADHDDSESDTG